MSMNMGMQGTGDDGDQGDGNNRKRKASGPPEGAPKNSRSRRSSSRQSTENPYAPPLRKSYKRQSSTGLGRTRGDVYNETQQAIAAEKQREADERAAYEKARSDEYKNRVRAPQGQRDDGQLHMVFIQMGQGDCAIISTPAGKSILVDCGTTATEEVDDNAYNARIQNILLGPKFLKGKQKLDMLILTHPDRDHYAKLKAILEGIVTEIGVFYHSCKFNGYHLNETSTWIDNILGSSKKLANKQVTCCDTPVAYPKQVRQVKPRGKIIYALPHVEMPNEQIDARGAIRILSETNKDIASTTTTITSSNVAATTTPVSIHPPVNTLVPMDTGAVPGNTALPTINPSPQPSSAATHSFSPPPSSSAYQPGSFTDESIPFDMDIDIDLNVELDPNDFLSPTIVSPPPPTHASTPQTTTTTATVAAGCDISILASNVYVPCAQTGSAWRDGTDENRHSIVLLIEAFGRKIMICGDATGGTEEFIMRAYPDVKDLDVLQIPHHGSDVTSSTPAFVARMNPESCIISAPRDARQHGHPCSSVIEAYRNNPRIGKNLPAHTIYYKERDGQYKSQKSSVEEQITDAIYITGSYGSCALTVSETGQLTISTLEVASSDPSSTTTTITTPQNTLGAQPQPITHTTTPVVLMQTPSTVPQPQQTPQPTSEPMSIDTPNKSQ